MNVSPRFSVVIPTYNRANFLKDAVNHVLSQTYADFEIIIVDDGSTDNTKEILDGLSDRRIRKLFISRTGIVGAVRNAGIREAKGEFVAFLDSDDLWFREKLEKTNSVFKANPDAVLVCHNMIENRINKSPVVHKYGPSTEQMYERLLFKGNCIGTSATVVKMDAILKAGLFSEDERFIGAEDYECWMRLAQIGEFCFLDQALGEYRIKGGNLSRDIRRITQSRLNVINHHYYDIFKRHTRGLNRLIKIRIADLLTKSARALQVEGCFEEARYYYKRALKENIFSILPYIGLVASFLRLKLDWVARIHLFLCARSVSY